MAEFSSDALARALQRTSDDIKRDVGALIPLAADQMANALERRYPLGVKAHPGVPHMRDDIRIRTVQSQDVLLPTRRVVGPHLAYIWQDGTVERSYPNTRSIGRHRTGRMPATDPNFFERTAIETRTAMMMRAQAILDRPREIT